MPYVIPILILYNTANYGNLQYSCLPLQDVIIRNDRPDIGILLRMLKWLLISNCLFLQTGKWILVSSSKRTLTSESPSSALRSSADARSCPSKRASSNTLFPFCTFRMKKVKNYLQLDWPNSREVADVLFTNCLLSLNKKARVCTLLVVQLSTCKLLRV